VIIRAYQDLWRELGHIRSHGEEIGAPVEGRPLHPLRDDPFAIFAGYATATVDGEAVVELVGAGAAGGLASIEQRLSALRAASMNDFAASVMLAAEDISAVLQCLFDNGPQDVFSLAERFDEEKRFRVPRTLAWLAKLGIVQLLEGDQGRRVTTPRPEDAETQRLVELGLSARGRGAMQAAVDYFEKALRCDPGDVTANVQMGEVLAGQGKLDAAAAAFRHALNRAPDNLPAQRNLGKALFLQGDERGGIEVMNAAVARVPEDADSRFLLGAAFRRTGDVNKAIRELERCLQIDKNRGDALFHLGLARKSLGRLDEAREAFSGAIDLDPRDVYAKAALFNMSAEEQGRKYMARNAGGRRVALHLNARGQYPVLRPVFDALKNDHWPMMTCDGRELQEFGPSVIVMAGNHSAALRKIAPDASIVNIGLGLASKNFLGRVRNPGDFLCAPSPAVATEIRERRGLPDNQVWATGYPAMDLLFMSGSDKPRANIRKTILYAPTDRSALSSVEMIGADVLELIMRGRDDLDLILKPHPRHCEQPPAWLAAWKELAGRHAHVTLVDDPAGDAAAFLMRADVLITDASSLMLEFLALNRPMVLITNPDHFADPTHFDAAGYEWMWRDMGEEVRDVELLSEAVNRALDNPDAKATIRAEYGNHLFGDLTDGGAAGRIARHISEIGANKAI
jgi:tetratricopeptide (TPR) repeat protein